VPHPSSRSSFPRDLVLHVQGIGYIVDVYRAKVSALRVLPRLLPVQGLFPQLIAGPIVAPGDYFRERLQRLDQPDHVGDDKTRASRCRERRVQEGRARGQRREDRDLAFLDPNGVSSLMMLLRVYAFASRSTSTSPAIPTWPRGLARMLGIDLPINFNLPYLARGLREFWQRWAHFTLHWCATISIFPWAARGSRTSSPTGPDHHHGVGRPVARRELTVLDLGRNPRRGLAIETRDPPGRASA